LATPAAAEVPESTKEVARTLLDEGDRRLEQGDAGGALDAYRKADAIMRVPTTTIEVASTLARLGSLKEARERAAAVLAHPERADEPAPFVAARERARALIADLDRRIPRTRISIRGRADAAPAVTIDGSPVAAGAEVSLDPGKHEVRATSGESSSSLLVDLREGERRTVAVARSEPAGDFVPVIATGASVLGVALGLAIGFGVVSVEKTNDIVEGCGGNQCPTNRHEAVAEAELYANVCNVSIGFAAAGAIGLAVGLGLELGQSDAGTIRISFAGNRLTFASTF
jgi:hypothetical protein